jgi:biotin transport system ATP-binding protein
VIKAEHIDYAYPGGPNILKDVSFELPPGATVGLAGANGSGKSTLLFLLAGLYAPTQGDLFIDGRRADADASRRIAGLVMQDADLQVLGADVGEDLTLGLAPEGQNSPQVIEIADRFGLTPLWGQPVQTLSWGQKRRLCLAAVLLKEPRILLLDEPFSGLDYPGIKEMRRTLAANREQGLTQVVAAHDLEPLADLADHWLVLADGRLPLSGTAEAVFDRLTQYAVRPPCAWQAGLGVKPWDWGGGEPK